MGKRSKKIVVGDPEESPQNLTFSFQYYDDSDSSSGGKRKYCLSSWSEPDISLTLTRLKEVSCQTLHEIKSSSSVYHFHEVYWHKTTERSGFPNRKVMELPAFQFAVLGVNKQKARVYGALSRNVFYVVWFDYHHEISPSFKKGT